MVTSSDLEGGGGGGGGGGEGGGGVRGVVQLASELEFLKDFGFEDGQIFNFFTALQDG